MAVELATAYVSIVAESSKLAPEVRKQLGVVEKDAGVTGERAGRSMGSRMSGILGKTLKRGAQAAGIGAAALAGTALVKGFGRLKAIDEAESKLRGLGHSAQDISGIMENVTDAVTGTAFGLDEAATAAASALASGIEPGKELQEYLTLIGDAATQGGASFNDMASIINKTTATGKVGMENLNQLSERGIGIMGWLADEYDVTGEKLNKMVSSGEVDLETFQKVLKENIGGAAQESGKTFSGALANMGAALGRVGAQFQKGIFDQMPGIFMGVSDQLDRLGPAAQVAGDALGRGLARAVEIIGPAASTAASGLSDMASIAWDRISGGAGALRDLVNLDWKQLDGKAIGAALGAAILGALDSLQELSGEVTKAVGGLFESIDWSGIGKSMSDNIKGFFEGLDGGAIAEGLVGAIGGALGALGDMTGTITEKLGELFAEVDWVGLGIEIGTFALPLALGLVTGILNGITDPGLWKGIWENLPQILMAVLAIAFAPAKLVGPLAKVLGKIPFVGTFLSRAVTWLNQLGGRFTGMLGGFFSSAWRAFTGKLKLPGAGLIKRILGAMKGIPGRVKSFFSDLGTRLFVWVDDAFQALGRGAAKPVSALIGFVAKLPGRILQALSRLAKMLIPRGAEMISGLRQGISSRVGAVVSFLRTIPGRIKSAFGNALTLLRDVGGNIVAGLVGGLRAGAGKVLDAARALVDKIPGPIRKMLGIQSPSRVMARIGRQITAGLVLGMGRGTKRVRQAARRLPRTVLTQMQTVLDKRGTVGLDKWLKGLRRRIRNSKLPAAMKKQMVGTINALDKQLNRYEKRFARAQNRLNKIIENYHDKRKEVASSLRGEDTFGQIGEPNTFGYRQTSFDAVFAAVYNRAAKLKRFAVALGKLQKAGIPAGLQQEIAGLGSEKGLEVANAILKGSRANQKQLFRNWNIGNRNANTAGKQVAESFYRTGISAQQGIINGLLRAKPLRKAARQLANRLTRQVRRALKIKSPSQVMADQVGVPMGQGVGVGYIAGADSMQKRIDARTARLVTPQLRLSDTHAATPASARATDPASMLDRMTINVTVGADSRTKAKLYVDGKLAAERLA